MSTAFDDIARLPAPDDNIAIATRQIEAGTNITYGDAILTASHTILIGHRFAVQLIAEGEHLRSWGQIFGITTKAIAAGDYICNADVLKELRLRSINIDLPDEANFQNELEHYQFDEAAFQPAAPLPRHEQMRTFMGYQRGGGRGVGTRNNIVLLGTTSLISGFVQKLESRLKNSISNDANVDNIIAVAHTEGGQKSPNNQDLLLRTLAGFVVHPNVGAVLIVDSLHGAINNQLLHNYMIENDYPLSDVPHQFMTLSESFDNDLAKAEQIVTSWFDEVNAVARTLQPLSALKIALQCGGSDAFSGISGNPLAAWVAKEVIQYGGAANLAETDELIGAESYVLDKVRDRAVAQKFLSFVERFKERVTWHGHSAHGNPSGGNKLRGIYNIYLKSLGASTKRHPDVPLDYVIDYAERMQESGFYFMDSPGNDLESIAGQVASGCNMIFFITGNGSITNFPFVPTIKIVTTTERYELLTNDMDINAGAYLDGMPMDELGSETLDYTINIASGELSVGEKAGHSQVQIWRNWQQNRLVDLQSLGYSQRSGKALPIETNIKIPEVSLPVYRTDKGYTSDQIGLIIPTSLCSGQIARMCVDVLNQHPMLKSSALSRFATLVHTEGCGASLNQEFQETLLGYLSHPFVKHALFLEHGCEAAHNGYFHSALMSRGYDPQDYGWASIQMAGGIQNVLGEMVRWFELQISQDTYSEIAYTGLESARVALLSHEEPPEEIVASFVRLTQMIVRSGGTVVVHEHDALMKTDYLQQLGIPESIEPSLAYAQQYSENGLHLMAMPTRDWNEIITGIGASGVELMLSYVDDYPLSGHPMIPVLQVSNTRNSEIDVHLHGTVQANMEKLLNGIVQTLARQYTPKLVQSGNSGFQITRGLLGVSL